MRERGKQSQEENTKSAGLLLPSQLKIKIYIQWSFDVGPGLLSQALYCSVHNREPRKGLLVHLEISRGGDLYIVISYIHCGLRYKKGASCRIIVLFVSTLPLLFAQQHWQHCPASTRHYKSSAWPFLMEGVFKLPYWLGLRPCTS